MARSSSGTFIPTTQVWDVSEIKDVDVTKPEFKELLVRMYQNLNLMSITVNNKESSYYDTSETVKGQSFFPNPNLTSTTPSSPENRQVYNKTINFGNLPNSTTRSYPHGLTINLGYTFTRIYGCATRKADPNSAAPTFNAIPLPYVDPVATNRSILLSVDANNVNITTAIDYSLYSSTYIILEYIKS